MLSIARRNLGLENSYWYGGGSSSYTKEETDALLDKKQEVINWGGDVVPEKVINPETGNEETLIEITHPVDVLDTITTTDDNLDDFSFITGDPGDGKVDSIKY